MMSYIKGGARCIYIFKRIYTYALVNIYIHPGILLQIAMNPSGSTVNEEPSFFILYNCKFNITFHCKG